jgi:UDP-N-acetylglucosamine--N-acetylmuramyl-(pentapeptide) pyrophosphoryl-undecaprenol N-acetylglucosamine transferase
MTEATNDIGELNAVQTSANRILIAGGGTGGHIFPAIAIANAIKHLAPETSFLFVGAQGKMEMEKVPQAGYSIIGINIAGLNRSSFIKNIGLPFKLLKSFFQVANIIRSFKPTAVIGVGGYSSFPVLRYAQGKGIATFIHESNSFAGKSNILLGKKAIKIFTATDGMESFFDAKKIMVTGNPIRQNIAANKVSKEEGIRFFGLDENKKTVLSIGGSLGAKSINEAIDQHLDLLINNDLQLIWQTGKPYKETAMIRSKGKDQVYVSDFISNMEMAYAAADLVISRSGAMAIAEIAVVKKPAVLVPYPFAAEDHQTANATNLVNKNAAILIPDGKALQELVPTVVALAKDETMQLQLKNNISACGIKDADQVIAATILGLIQGKTQEN